MSLKCVKKDQVRFVGALKLFKLHNVSLINLTDAKVFSDAVVYMLESHKLVKSLTIQNNNFQLNTNFNDNALFEKISFIISQNPLLNSLTLQYQNNLNNFIKLTAGIGKNNSIQHLNLSNNVFNGNETSLVILTIKHCVINNNLKSLSISKTCANANFLNLILTEVRNISTLETLDISANVLDNNSLPILDNLTIDLKRLCTLNLTQCSIINSMAEPFKKVFENTKALRDLNLSMNVLGDAFINNLNGLLNLEVLNLSSCQLTYNTLPILIKIIDSNTKLQTLNLNSNNFTMINNFNLNNLATAESLGKFHNDLLESNNINSFLVKVSKSSVINLYVASCNIIDQLFFL